MAGAHDAEMPIAVSAAGALGSLPCAMLNAEQIRAETDSIKSATDKPFNLNFFCHSTPADDPEQISRWLKTLEPFYQAEGIDDLPSGGPARKPFDESLCEVVENCKPAVVSFHFGLPAEYLVARVKALGSLIISSATTVNEALWLVEHGCDAVIAQGSEAGGHRGIFLTDDPVRDASAQPGIMALLPDIVEAVDVPVIAAGGIANAQTAHAALNLGASMVQIGTGYLFTREARISALHRQALNTAEAHDTALTNLFSGRPARGLMTKLMREIGPLNEQAAAFPLAGAALTPLKKKAEADGRTDYTSLWAGQAVAAARRSAQCTAQRISDASEASSEFVNPGAADLTRYLTDQIERCSR